MTRVTTDQAEKYDGAYRASMAQQRDEGRVEGRAEGKLEMAERLFRRGMDLSFVMEVTGLPKEELEPIQRSVAP